MGLAGRRDLARPTFGRDLGLIVAIEHNPKIIAGHRRTTGRQCRGFRLPWPCEADLTSADDPPTVRGAAGAAAWTTGGGPAEPADPVADLVDTGADVAGRWLELGAAPALDGTAARGL